MSFAPQMGSSDFRAISDDTAKDDESVAFLAALPLAQQAEWLARLGWLRLADRLSENQVVEPEQRRFDMFRHEWQAFLATGEVIGRHANVWREMRAAWFTPSGKVCEERAVAAWDAYVEALGTYTQPGLEIVSLEEHDRMLQQLTGNLFEVFPYLRDDQRDAASRFGMLDQMMNNARDIAEDARHGLCFFPRDVLSQFGLSRDSVLSGEAPHQAGYGPMMHYWLDEHLAVIRAGAEPFAKMGDLHPSLVCMREAFLKRYGRVEQVLRSCEMNYLEFPRVYWGSRPMAPADAEVA